MEHGKIPACVGFIMDGNRRWAKARGLSVQEGHAAGYARMRDMIRIVHAAHIPHMVCYAFSTENWKRSEEEVSDLVALLGQGIIELRRTYEDSPERVNIRVIGELSRLPEALQKDIADMEAHVHSDPALTVWIAFSYGGRAEIVDAVNRAVAHGVQVSEADFGEMLWTRGMPDPDFIIRTSGEQRLSNFLLWQSAYSELFFVDTYWPDLGETEFQSILEQYGNRKRRGGV